MLDSAPILSGNLRAVGIEYQSVCQRVPTFKRRPKGGVREAGQRSASRVCVFVSVYLLFSGEPEHEIVPMKWALFVSVYPPLSGDLRAVSVRPDRRWPLAGSWARPAAKAARASPW